MLKLLWLCGRRPDLSHAEYRAHLLERHTPLALRHHAKLRGYRQHLVEACLGDAPAIDSLNALEYDALGDASGYDSPEGERLVSEDHARFLGSATGYATRERVALEPRRAGSPLPGFVCALRRNPRVDAERFARALESDMAPELLASRPNTARLALDFVDSRLFAAEPPEWDAFVEIYFESAPPLHPFHSPDCGVSLLRRVNALSDALAVWRTVEHVHRAAGP